MTLPSGRHPSERRPVIHRELLIIRRISREHLQDRAQDYAIDDNCHLGDTHEHPLFQTHRLRSRSRRQRPSFKRPRIPLRAAVSAEHVSDRFRQGSRCAPVAQLEGSSSAEYSSSGRAVRAPALARQRRLRAVTLSRLTNFVRCDILSQATTQSPSNPNSFSGGLISWRDSAEPAAGLPLRLGLFYLRQFTLLIHRVFGPFFSSPSIQALGSAVIGIALLPQWAFARRAYPA